MTSRPVLSLLCLAVLLGAAVGLTVDPVRLINRSYITFALNTTANNSVIDCPYTLNEGERVSQVVWKFFEEGQEVGGYVWSPRAGGRASGRLHDVVDLTRDDAALELTELRYDLGGEYSCRVELNNGEAKESDPWEVLIVDVIGSSHLNSYSPKCLFMASFNSPTMYPEPTLSAGMYSESQGRYIKQVSSMEWLKILYPNDSMAYSFRNFTFEIDSETPNDIVFDVSLGFTKANGDYISLGKLISNSSSWGEYGCPNVEEGTNKDVYFFPGGSYACRGGRKPTTKATIVCKRGYQPKGEVGTVVLRCDADSLTWRPEKGHTALDEDLVCVKTDIGSGGGGSPRSALLSSSLFFVSLLLLLVLGRENL